MEENKLHNIIMEKREKLSISGVKDIGIYNEEIVELSTVMGELVVKGSNMHINKFNTDDGELKIEGNINSVAYEEEKMGSPGTELLWLFCRTADRVQRALEGSFSPSGISDLLGTWVWKRLICGANGNSV